MSKTVPFPLPVLGVDLLSSETALIKGSVRSAVNIDIGRAGRYARRKGYSSVLNETGLHSVYYAPQKGWTVVGYNDELHKYNAGNGTTTYLAQLNSPDPLTYTEYNGNLYFSSRSTLGWVPGNSDEARQVGVPTPAAPTLTTQTSGGLLPGKYGVVITMVDDRGEESGACAVQTIDLPDGGGIRLSNLPERLESTVFIYVTGADDDRLRLVATPPAVFPTYLISDIAKGSGCDTQHLIPMPPGEMVCWHNGRLVTANNGAVRFSEPLRPHLHNPAHGVLPFSGYISFIESVGDGMYIGDSRGVWFLNGKDPVKTELRRVSSCRAVHRSSIMVPPEHFDEKTVPVDSPVAVWLSTSGYVVGMPGGTTVELHPDRIKVPAGLSGRTTFLLRNGRKQLVTPVNSTSTATFGTAVDAIIS